MDPFLYDDDFSPTESVDTNARAPMTVTQVTAQIRNHLESHFGRLWIEGEIRNWSVAGSGHVYFSLRDEGALISAVMWRSTHQKLSFNFKDGDLVEARGKISLFEKRGQYQILVDSLKPVGEGLLWRKFIELKAKLEREGLFDPVHKKIIPTLPAKIGVITSPTGAAIRDVLSILRRRAPGVEILVWPARVQGVGAAQELAEGVRKLAASGLVDVIIIGRGGGSLEDLWEFNDERLAREIHGAPIPIISAVGHEVDFTICDFVADLRAATPSAAAELVSADRAQLRLRLLEGIQRMDRALDNRLANLRSRLGRASNSYALREPEILLRNAQQRVDLAFETMDESMNQRLSDLHHRVNRCQAALQGHNPELILRKGYAIVRGVKDERVIASSNKLRPGTHVHAYFQDGRARLVATDDAPDLFEET